jgi:uncharacterized protein with HEPN domain
MMASKRDPRVYLQDILSAIERIAIYNTKGREGFFTDTLLQDGIIRQLSIVGEASAKLPRSVREQHPEIPWKLIVGMRNIIIHEYSDIDLEVIWDSLNRDLPVFRKTIESMLTRAE